MAYKALTYFEDLQDNNHPYHKGSTYPRAGYVPSPERIAELLSSNNLRGKAVIEADVIEKPPVAIIEPPVVVKQDDVDPLPAKPKRGRKRKSE